MILGLDNTCCVVWNGKETKSFFYDMFSVDILENFQRNVYIITR